MAEDDTLEQKDDGRDIKESIPLSLLIKSFFNYFLDLFIIADCYSDYNIICTHVDLRNLKEDAIDYISFFDEDEIIEKPFIDFEYYIGEKILSFNKEECEDKYPVYKSIKYYKYPENEHIKTSKLFAFIFKNRIRKEKVIINDTRYYVFSKYLLLIDETIQNKAKKSNNNFFRNLNIKFKTDKDLNDYISNYENGVFKEFISNLDNESELKTLIYDKNYLTIFIKLLPLDNTPSLFQDSIAMQTTVLFKGILINISEKIKKLFKFKK